MGYPSLATSNQQQVHDPVAEFISAMLIDGTYDPAAHGISGADIYSHQRVHEFALEYQSKTGHAPTPEQVLKRYSDFPFDECAEVEWTAHELQKEIRSRRLRRLLMKASQTLIDGSIDEALAELVNGISLIPTSMGKPELASNTQIYFEPPPPRCPVAGRTLMYFTEGIEAGQVWYIGARPGRGKSWELIRHAIAACEAGWDVVFFSLEMSARAVLERMHRTMVGFHPDTQVMVQRVDQWFAQPGRGKIEIYDPSRVRCDLLAVDRVAKPNTLIIIDYIGLMPTTDGRKSVEDRTFAAAISNGLKEIALRRMVPIIAATQLNRASADEHGSRGERKTLPPPSLNDMSNTDSLGQDADLVYYLRSKQGSTVREIRLMKNRNRGGEGSYWFIEFLPGLGKFEEISMSRATAIIEREAENDFTL